MIIIKSGVSKHREREEVSTDSDSTVDSDDTLNSGKTIGKKTKRQRDPNSPAQARYSRGVNSLRASVKSTA